MTKRDLWKALREISEKCDNYQRHYDSQNRTIWTYQDFFVTFEDELKPLLDKWKKLHKKDIYVVDQDPVETYWLGELKKIQKEERQARYNAVQEQKRKLKEQCKCGAIK